MDTSDLILASTSPFRRALLANAGIVVRAEAPLIDERALEEGLGSKDPVTIARSLSERKAIDVSTRHPEAIVIGGDQTLSLGDRLFHKPRDRAEARRHLEAFSGRTHHLNSGVAIARAGGVLWSHVEIAAISFRTLTSHAIETYLDLAGDNVLKSVGAYQIEGPGIRLMNRIEGDHFTIVGLPLLPLLEALRTLKVMNDA